MQTSNFIQLAKTRYSCRKYENRPVEREKLDRILVKLSLGRKLDRVVPALALREVTVKYEYRIAVEFILPTDKTLLRFIMVIG